MGPFQNNCMIFGRPNPTSLVCPLFTERDTDTHILPRHGQEKHFTVEKDAGVQTVASRSTDKDSPVGFKVVEEDNAWQLHVIPGVRPQDVQIEESEGGLSVKAEHRSEDNAATQYHKQFSFDSTLNVHEITTELSDGVLNITVPKKSAPESLSV